MPKSKGTMFMCHPSILRVGVVYEEGSAVHGGTPWSA